MSWSEAQSFCFNLGGYLAEVRNQGTLTFLEANAPVINGPYGHYWWLGATDKESVSFL